MKVVIVLPTYNERDNIHTLLDLLRTVCARIPQYSFSYIVVDDNSPDGTAVDIRSYIKSHNNVYLITGPKKGLGKALLRGLTYGIDTLHAQILIQMDADLSHNPEVLPEFIKAIDRGADIAVGSRYIRGGSIPANWKLYRKIFSVLGNLFVRFGLGFTNIHDWTGGYRAFRARLFPQIRNEMTSYSGYVFQIALLHKLIKKGFIAVEVPIQFTDRRYGKSKIAPTEYIKNVLTYVISERLKRLISGPFGKFLIVGSAGFFINTFILEIFVFFGINPVIGSIFGAELAIISNFILNNTWTFKSRRVSGNALIEQFFKFNGASFGAIIIQASAIYIGTYFSGISSYRYYYLFGVGLGLIWNYTMYSRVIWK